MVTWPLRSESEVQHSLQGVLPLPRLAEESQHRTKRSNYLTFIKGEGKMITNQPKATQTHLINKQPDLIPHFQAAIDCSYVQDIPSSDLSVLHRKLSFLRGVKEETNT